MVLEPFTSPVGSGDWIQNNVLRDAKDSVRDSDSLPWREVPRTTIVSELHGDYSFSWMELVFPGQSLSSIGCSLFGKCASHLWHSVFLSGNWGNPRTLTFFVDTMMAVNYFPLWWFSWSNFTDLIQSNCCKAGLWNALTRWCFSTSRGTLKVIPALYTYGFFSQTSYMRADHHFLLYAKIFKQGTRVHWHNEQYAYNY